jgi:hypothetical protein
MKNNSIYDLETIDYKNASIFVNKVKGQHPFGIVIYELMGRKVVGAREQWFSSVSDAKIYIDDSMDSLYQK